MRHAIVEVLARLEILNTDNVDADNVNVKKLYFWKEW